MGWPHPWTQGLAHGSVPGGALIYAIPFYRCRQRPSSRAPVFVLLEAAPRRFHVTGKVGCRDAPGAAPQTKGHCARQCGCSIPAPSSPPQEVAQPVAQEHGAPFCGTPSSPPKPMGRSTSGCLSQSSLPRGPLLFGQQHAKRILAMAGDGRGTRWAQAGDAAPAEPSGCTGRDMSPRAAAGQGVQARGGCPGMAASSPPEPEPLSSPTGSSGSPCTSTP